MKKNSYSTIEESTLLRYLEGKLHDKERVRVEEWYSASEENAKLLERLYIANALHRGVQAASRVDVDKAFADFDSRLRLEKRAASDRKYKRLWFSLTVVGVLLLLILRTGSDDTVEIRTASADSISIFFRDGSQVLLKPRSGLIYANPLPHRPKTLRLNGEACFDIVKKNVVRIGGVKARAAGTRFEVSAADDGNTIRLSVLSGSVKVSFADRGMKKVTLHHDQRMVYDAGSSVIWVDNADRIPNISY